MTDTISASIENKAGETSFHESDFAVQRLKRRYGKEMRFRWWGRAAISIALAALLWLLVVWASFCVWRDQSNPPNGL